MNGPSVEGRGARRAAAVASLLALAAGVLVLTFYVAAEWEVVLLGRMAVGAAVVSGWFVVSRRGALRLLAIGALLACLAAFVVLVLVGDSLRGLVAGLAMGGLSVATAGYALRPSTAPGPQAAETPVAPARHPVLLMNPRSGGGKAERFRLAERCRERGIEPIGLGRGTTCSPSPRTPSPAGRT